MKMKHSPRLMILWTILAATVVRADYESHPELRPEARCATIRQGIVSTDCQPLFWDLPAATRLGFAAAAAPIPESRPPRYPGGLTDRPPPLFILDVDGDGKSDDGKGYESPAPGRVRLCADPDDVPWWQPSLDAAGEPVITRDPIYGQEGPLFTVACRRGTRVRFGPWQIGRHPLTSDQIVEGVLRIENSERLDRDAASRGLDVNRHGRIEWHTGTEFYSHFTTHHAVCWNPENRTCNNPEDPWSASDAKLCRSYQSVADGPEAPGGVGACYAGDQDTRCRKPEETGETVRDFVMFPGRVYVPQPDGQAEPVLEDQLLDCYQHLVPELPPKVPYHVEISRYGLNGRADYRRQDGGLVNVSGERREETDPGRVIGGAVGEMVLQYFTEPFTAPGYATAHPGSTIRKGGLEDLVRSGRVPPVLRTPTPAR